MASHVARVSATVPRERTPAHRREPALAATSRRCAAGPCACACTPASTRSPKQAPLPHRDGSRRPRRREAGGGVRARLGPGGRPASDARARTRPSTSCWSGTWTASPARPSTLDLYRGARPQPHLAVSGPSEGRPARRRDAGLVLRGTAPLPRPLRPQAPTGRPPGQGRPRVRRALPACHPASAAGLAEFVGRGVAVSAGQGVPDQLVDLVDVRGRLSSTTSTTTDATERHSRRTNASPEPRTTATRSKDSRRRRPRRRHRGQRRQGRRSCR